MRTIDFTGLTKEEVLMAAVSGFEQPGSFSIAYIAAQAYTVERLRNDIKTWFKNPDGSGKTPQQLNKGDVIDSLGCGIKINIRFLDNNTLEENGGYSGSKSLTDIIRDRQPSEHRPFVSIAAGFWTPEDESAKQPAMTAAVLAGQQLGRALSDSNR